MTINREDMVKLTFLHIIFLTRLYGIVSVKYAYETSVKDFGISKDVFIEAVEMGIDDENHVPFGSANFDPDNFEVGELICDMMFLGDNDFDEETYYAVKEAQANKKLFPYNELSDDESYAICTMVDIMEGPEHTKLFKHLDKNYPGYSKEGVENYLHQMLGFTKSNGMSFSLLHQLTSELAKDGKFKIKDNDWYKMYDLVFNLIFNVRQWVLCGYKASESAQYANLNKQVLFDVVTRIKDYKFDHDQMIDDVRCDSSLSEKEKNKKMAEINFVVKLICDELGLEKLEYIYDSNYVN